MPAASPSIHIEARGALLLSGAAALLAAGLLRVDGAMAALGAGGLMLAGLSGWAARANLKGLAVELSGPHATAAGRAIRLRTTLRNPRRGLDAFGVRVELKVPGSPESTAHAPWVSGRSAADVELHAVPGSRGDHDHIGVTLRSGFPFGMFVARHSFDRAHRLLVFPRPLTPVELLACGAWVDDTPRAALAAGEAQGEPRGLRPYRSGDPARAIAWPATMRSRARGGGLVVREVDPPGFHPREVAVLFHSYGTDRALIRPDRFERALSLAWGALRHFQDQGLPVRLLADFDGWQPRPAGTRRQLGLCGELLAKARRANGTEAHEVQAILSGLDDAVGTVMVSDMPLSSWRSFLRPAGPWVPVDVTAYEPKARPQRGGGKLRFQEPHA